MVVSVDCSCILDFELFCDQNIHLNGRLSVLVNVEDINPRSAYAASTAQTNWHYKGPKACACMCNVHTHARPVFPTNCSVHCL